MGAGVASGARARRGRATGRADLADRSARTAGGREESRGIGPGGSTMAPPRRVTDGTWNAQHLYFTSSSLTSDDRRLVVIGDRDGVARGPYDPDAAVNVFVVDLESGEAERVSRNAAGVLRSYVYFGGHPDRGIAPGSVVLHPD